MTTLKDLKAALGNASKPDHSHVRTTLLTYVARACEYGSAKYERGNYMRQAGEGTPRDNFLRLRGYLRSVQTHTSRALDSMERHLMLDPQLLDVEGMQRAAFAPDRDVTPGAKVCASLLPHVAHLGAGLMMALVQAVMYGTLPEDPGQPWAADGECGVVGCICADTKDLHPPSAIDVSEPEHVCLLGPTDNRPRCEHNLLVGRRCIRCPGGTATII